jgi:hypothetical protein
MLDDKTTKRVFCFGANIYQSEQISKSSVRRSVPPMRAHWRSIVCSRDSRNADLQILEAQAAGCQPSGEVFWYVQLA